MSVVSAEQVLVVPTSLFHELGHFQGFSREVDRYLPTLLDPANTRFEPRGEMETNPAFKQLIPYCVFRHRDPVKGDSLFRYTRGKGQGEGRLHSKWSVGVGGHISSLDAEPANGRGLYREGLLRELQEEIQFEGDYQETRAGLINDDETEVGRVHLGVVHLFEMAHPTVQPREPDLVEAGFLPIAELFANLERFETWSRICLEALFQA